MDGDKRFIDLQIADVEIGEGRRERHKRKEKARMLREQAPVIDAIVTKVLSLGTWETLVTACVVDAGVFHAISGPGAKTNGGTEPE